MRQRGRKSAANLASLCVDGKPPRLEPPATFNEAERNVFVDIVGASAPEHSRPSDLPLLVSYVQATVLGEQAATELRNGAVIDGKPSPWITVQEKCVRAMVALSLRLRLAPQSRIQPRGVGRFQAPLRLPWMPGEDGNDDD